MMFRKYEEGLHVINSGMNADATGIQIFFSDALGTSYQGAWRYRREAVSHGRVPSLLIGSGQVESAEED
jgi:hypothetical protein